MADLAQLAAALRAADEAGNEEDARRLAKAYAAARAAQAAPPKPKTQFTVGDTPGMDPTEGQSFGENMVQGAGKSLVDAGHGVKQWFADGGFMGMATRAGGQALGFEMANPGADAMRVEQDRRREQDQRLMDAPGGFLGNAIGTVGQFIGPGGVLKAGANVPVIVRNAPAVATGMRAAGSAALPSTIRGAATQGAVIGATQPVGTEDSRLANTALGGAFGAAGAAIPRGAGMLARLLAKPFRGVRPSGIESKVAEVLRREAANPAALGQAAPSAIPGVQRTLAEESLDPGIARLERWARSRNGQLFDPIDRANNAARVGAIEQFAGDDAAMAAAKAARDKAALPLRKQALAGQDVDVSRLLTQVERLAKAQDGRPAVQAGLRQVGDLLAKGEGTAKVAVLDNVRKTIGDMLGGKYGGDNAAALAGSRELMVIRNQLDRALAKQAPAYGQYLDAFRQGSQPINRMQIGQELLGARSGSAVLDPVTGQQQLLPAAFSRAARNLDDVAASATGFRKAKADQILQPQDRQTIAAVQDDLERRSFAVSAGSGGGSPTFERGALDQKVMAGLVRRIPGAGWAFDELERIGQARLQAKLAEVLANPSEARAILARVPQQDRRLLEDLLSRTGGVAGVATAGALE